MPNNSNQSAQTDSSNEENDASENVQTIYSVPVSFNVFAMTGFRRYCVIILVNLYSDSTIYVSHIY